MSAFERKLLPVYLGYFLPLVEFLADLMMTGTAATLLLQSEGAKASRALLQEAAGSSSSLPLPQFLSSSAGQSSAYETVFLSLDAADKNAAVAAASKLLSVLKADGLLIAAVEGKEYSEVRLNLLLKFILGCWASPGPSIANQAYNGNRPQTVRCTCIPMSKYLLLLFLLGFSSPVASVVLCSACRR